MNYNMWGSVKDKAQALGLAIEITGNHKVYGKLMLEVISLWPVSCENALTDYSINRKAWLGHAAMAFGYKIPENIIRQAWQELTHEQRELANREAENAIEKWEYNYRQNKQLHSSMGEQMLLRGFA